MTEGYYSPELAKNDDIGTINWPTLPDLPKIKRPHLNWTKSKANKVNPSVQHSTHSVLESVRYKPAVTFRAWSRFWKLICACCYYSGPGKMKKSSIYFGWFFSLEFLKLRFAAVCLHLFSFLFQKAKETLLPMTEFIIVNSIMP